MMLLAFEPVTSHAYDFAREEYLQGTLELGLIKSHDDVNSQSNFYCSKNHFIRCVGLLDNLHSKGEVECVDNLPLPGIITGFSRSQLKSLSEKLKELYFPDVN